MSDWTGVLIGTASILYEYPKRELLLFDKLAVFGFDQTLDVLRNHWHGDPRRADQLDALKDQGILEVSDLPPPSFFARPGNQSQLDVLLALARVERHFDSQMVPGQRDAWGGDFMDFSHPRFADNIEAFKRSQLAGWARMSLTARVIAAHLSESGTSTAVSATPLTDIARELLPDLQSKVSGSVLSSAVEVVVSQLPVPDDSTPLEDILAFRTDPDANRKLAALRVWMREVATVERRPVEIAEKLEWLLHEYERHMRIHRMKVNKGVLECVVTSSLEFAEDLVKLQWSKVAKTLFSLKMRRLQLLEAESTAPGREVAYVAATRQAF